MEVGNWHYFVVLSVCLEDLAAHFSCSSCSSNQRPGPHDHRECLSHWFLVWYWKLSKNTEVTGTWSWHLCYNIVNDTSHLCIGLPRSSRRCFSHRLSATVLTPRASLLLKVPFGGIAQVVGRLGEDSWKMVHRRIFIQTAIFGCSLTFLSTILSLIFACSSSTPTCFLCGG